MLAAIAAVVIAPEAAHASDPVAGHTYKMVAQNSNKCVDVVGASTADGARVQQWKCSTSTAWHQYWNLVSDGSGRFYIRNGNSGKCLDIRGSSTADGAVVQQWSCNGGNQQRFIIEGNGGTYRVRNLHSDRCLDVTGFSSENGVMIQQWGCFPSFPSNQRFRFDLVA